jgi:catechol 1,2-dioxygenase
VTQVFDNADAAIESDVVFGVTPALSGDFARQPDGAYKLEYDFVLQAGERRIPRPPLP